MLHFGTEQELEQGTATGDIAAGDPSSDLASSVPALILPTPDGPDPPSELAYSVPALIFSTPDGRDTPSDLASSVPALSLPNPEGPALSDPTPDGFPPSPDDHFLPPHGWLEYPDPSLQIVAASASPSLLLLLLNLRQMWLFLLLCNHNLIQSSAPLSSPAQLHCDVDPVSALVHFC